MARKADEPRETGEAGAIAELGVEDIREILGVFTASDLEELRIEIGSTLLHVSRRSGGVAVDTRRIAEPPVAEPAAGPPATVGAGGEPTAARREAADAAPPAATGSVELRSPALGVFYRRPAPGEPTFVEVGSEVGPDDPVCIIDVMKLFTRVPAGTAGRIVEICVEDGELVEHGQLLMRIEPT